MGGGASAPLAPAVTATSAAEVAAALGKAAGNIHNAKARVDKWVEMRRSSQAAQMSSDELVIRSTLLAARASKLISRSSLQQFMMHRRKVIPEALFRDVVDSYGNRSIGRFVAGQLSDEAGRRECANGDVYTGEFKHGEASGRGLRRSANGDVCTLGSADDESFVCVDEGAGMGLGVCEQICAAAGDACTPGAVDGVNENGFVCLDDGTGAGACELSCVPYIGDEACADGEWCEPLYLDDGGTCQDVPEGGANIGEACDGETTVCDEELICVSSSCKLICDPNAEADSAAACGEGEGCWGLSAGDGIDLTVGACYPACDYDAGTGCDAEGSACMPAELIGDQDQDLCDDSLHPVGKQCSRRRPHTIITLAVNMSSKLSSIPTSYRVFVVPGPSLPSRYRTAIWIVRSMILIPSTRILCQASIVVP